MPARTQLLIGDVAMLTGISAGRIRHYESIGLLAPAHLESGYRTFAPEDVLVLLRIDLLRSLGLGLGEIRACLQGVPETLRQALEEHRAVLELQRQRLERLLAAVDGALNESEDDPEALMARLATTHRDSLGLLGRLSRPLSATAAAAYAEIFGSWDLPVPPLFGQMLLPEAVTDFLEQLADAPGHEELFGRLQDLARQVVALPDDADHAAMSLAHEWVKEQLTTSMPAPLAAVIEEIAPRLADLPVIRHGFLAWAESLSPVAGQFMREVDAEAHRQGADVLGVILVKGGGEESAGSAS